MYHTVSSVYESLNILNMLLWAEALVSTLQLVSTLCEKLLEHRFRPQANPHEESAASHDQKT